MRALYLIRHSLTLANEQRLYGGSTDSPLTERGREIAIETRAARPLTEAEIYISSGMIRADETLQLLTGHAPDLRLPQLREMDFGAFEMRSYEALKHEPEYIRWIEDATGAVACPGGECGADFRARVLEGGRTLLEMEADTAIVVCHGGVIVRLMEAWFPQVQRQFYEWQPAACRGYRVDVEAGIPVDYNAM